MNLNPHSHDENLKKAEWIAYLIVGHIRDTLTEEEQDALDAWIVESDENLELFERLTDEENIEMAVQGYLAMENQKAEALERIKKGIHKAGKAGSLLRLWPL